MFNLVILTGRLTADPELRRTQSDVPFTSFSIAIQRKYRSGEEPITDFINIQAWRSSAEFICKYFKKGSLIGIEGAIQTRRFQDKDGNNRTAFEVIVNNVQFVETKKNDRTVDIPSPDPLAQIQENLDNANFSSSEDDDLPF